MLSSVKCNWLRPAGSKGILPRRATTCCRSADTAEDRAMSKNLVYSHRRGLLLGGLAGSVNSLLAAEPGHGATNSAREGACKESSSPVDIPLPPSDAAEPAGQTAQSPLEAIKLKYPKFVKGTVVNTGTGTPQVNLPGGCTIQIGREEYELLEFHFHAPSEHAFDGKHAVMDAHFVHKHDSTGELLVLAVMLQPGAGLPNPCLEAALTSAPPQPGIEVPLNKPISLLSLLPKPRSADGKRPYATYNGALTSQPCSGNVRWVVFLDPLKVQAEQVLDFMYFGSGGRTLELNARTEQPLGGRKLCYFI